MKAFLVVLFLLLALSAGVLVGWALSSLLPGRKRRQRNIWGSLGLGVLLATGAAAAYLFGLRGNGSGTYPVSSLPSSLPWARFQFEADKIQIPKARRDA